MNRILALLIIACVGMSRAQAQFISPVRIDSFLLDLYSKDVFNGGLAVVDQGKSVYIGTFGIADSEPTLLAKETPFPAGELAQQFTAWVVTRFISEGTLRFDDAITNLFPTLSDSVYGTVTVRDLVHHTSGLPTYNDLFDEYSSYFNNGIFNTKIINVLEKGTPELRFSPGSQYERNPVNYAVLTLIVEQLTKQPFRSYLQSALFDSLGIFVPHDSIDRVHGLLQYGEEFYERDSISYYRTYGKVQPLLSLDDWIAWLKYLDTPERWDSAHYEIFFSNPPHYFASIPRSELFGMGLKWSEDTTVLFQSEFWNGISKYVQYSINDDISFILFENADINRNDFKVIVATLNDILKSEIEAARYRFEQPIDSNSPIIHARSKNSSLSATDVYSKIAQIDDWSGWQSDVDRVYSTHTDGESVEWKMKVSGKKVKGETHTLNPPYTIGWTESRFGIRRIINCRVYSMKDGCKIEIHSSTSGLFAKLFTKKNELRSKQRVDELLAGF